MHKHWAKCILVVVTVLALPANATWSIVLVDRVTREVAVGSATCVINIDLEDGLPVVRVNRGAAAAQAAYDPTGAYVAIIWNELEAATDPNAILDLLAAADPGHQTRQYGIVDVFGRAATFSGASTLAHASGVTGEAGNIVYAIQGNVLTGRGVVDAAEAAILDTPGDMPEKLMAAMEAAYTYGGDGRCSCSTRNPPGCGSPPPSFTKTAHVGFMIVARSGDADGTLCPTFCASGDYHMNLNVANQVSADPDPVLQLREQFDAWRAENVGAPDAAASLATLTPSRVLNDGTASVLRVEVLDWQGAAVVDVASVVVAHEPDSAGSSQLGAVVALGGGVFEAALTSSAVRGIDRFSVSVTAADGKVRPLIPSPALLVQDSRADLNFDGVVDLTDLGLQLANWGADGAGDLDGNGRIDLGDLGEMLVNFQPGF